MRYPILDNIRGISMVSMMIYHLVWDLVYIGGIDWQWYESGGAYIWQQSICWTFILLSGFCWSMGKHKVKRGLITFGAGAVVTLITTWLVPENKIVFGILTLLGSCMLFMIPLEKLLNKVESKLGIVIFGMLFILFKSINEGYIGIENYYTLTLPNTLYQGYLMTYFGFQEVGFVSTDYFSIFPWIFLFITGYFIYRLCGQVCWFKELKVKRLRGITFLGKHSLGVYLIHQPIIYLGLSLYLEML